MISIASVNFGGHTCIQLANDSLSLWATTDVGPRLLGLALKGGENLFAELPDLALNSPKMAPFHLYGGHRLWYAPEEPDRTYLPDDLPVEVVEIEAGLQITQPTESETGIQKQISVRLAGDEARVVVEHKLFNRGEQAVELAPWAITQMKTGGEALLPVSAPVSDSYGLLPNRSLILWPYSDLGLPQLRFSKHFLRLRADIGEGAFKVGFPNPSGWLAYRLGDSLFVKHTPYQPGAAYYDQGSSSECYCNARFVELESLGPRVSLQAGQCASHTETWSVYGGVSFGEDEASLFELLRRLDLNLAGGDS